MTASTVFTIPSHPEPVKLESWPDSRAETGRCGPSWQDTVSWHLQPRGQYGLSSQCPPPAEPQFKPGVPTALGVHFPIRLPPKPFPTVSPSSGSRTWPPAGFPANRHKLQFSLGTQDPQVRRRGRGFLREKAFQRGPEDKARCSRQNRTLHAEWHQV